MTDSKSETRALSSAAGFMTALPDHVRQQLLRHGRSRHFSKGELIQQRGDPGHAFWFIERGTVQIGRFSVDGTLNLFALLGVGESFGEQAFLGEFPRLVDAIAGSDATLIRIGEDELQAAITADVSVARILLKAMATMVQLAFDMLEEGREVSTVERVSKTLLRLCAREQAGFAIAVTQQELADLVGVSRVSLGKALTKLEAANIIARGYGRIIITDPERLKDRLPEA